MEDKLPLPQRLASASWGAFLVTAVNTPFDVLKVRLQASQRLASPRLACSCCSTGPSPALVKLVRHEGFLSLWSGLQPALLTSVPGTVLYFTCYENVRDAISGCLPRAYGEVAPLLAGGVARILAATVVAPFELMRTRMQAEQALRQEGMIRGALHLVRREGGLGLWRGLAPTLWRDVPFSMLYWSGYEQLTQRARAAHPLGELDLSDSFSAGALVGALAAVLTTPFDVAKTRQQVTDRAVLGSEQRAAFTPAGRGVGGTGAMLMRIARQEGVGALFAGVVPRLAKVAPSCAIMIASYEAGKRYFAERQGPARHL